MEDALEESERKLRHASKLVATMKNDRESLQTELASVKGEDAYLVRKKLEDTELLLHRSQKEVERLSKKSRVCTIS